MLENYRRRVTLDMLNRTPLFAGTDFYKNLRSDVVKRFKEKLKRGRIAVAGNYETIFGNPYEFLCAVIDKNYEPTEPLLLSGEQVYTTRFETGITLAPHCAYVYVDAFFRRCDDPNGWIGKVNSIHKVK